MSLQRDSSGRPGRQTAGVISDGRACPYCDASHGAEVVFCPATGMALPGAKDEFCGRELAGGIVAIRPVRREEAMGFYEGRTQDGTRVLIKRMLQPGPLDRKGLQGGGSALGSHNELARQGRVLSLVTDLHFVPKLLLSDEDILALEWIEGPKLADRLEGSNKELPTITIQQAIDWSLSVISSVRILHKRRLYHGHISAESILLREPDDRPVLAGFETAMVFDSNQPTAELSDEEGATADETDRPRMEAERQARNRDLSACSTLTYRLLMTSLGFSQTWDRKTDLSAAVHEMPDPLAGPLLTMLEQLQSTETGIPLRLLANQLESLRIHVDRHLRRDQPPTSFIPAVSVRSEATEPVQPVENQQETAIVSDGGHWGLAIGAGVALLALAGALWLIVLGHNKSKTGASKPPGRSPVSRAGRTDGQGRDKAMPPPGPRETIRPSSPTPQGSGRTLPRRNAAASPSDKRHDRSATPRAGPRRTVARSMGRPTRGTKKPRGKPLGEDDFVHAVDKAPEDL